jgi:hypothetical protein
MNKQLIIILVLLQFHSILFCQENKNTESMKEIYYIPQEFHEISLGYYEPKDAIFSPFYDKRKPWGYYTNKIIIYVPQKIIYYPGSCGFSPVIPVCGDYDVTDRRAYKYYHLSTDVLSIQKVGDETWYSGEVLPPPTSDLIIISRDKKEEKELKKRSPEIFG